MPIYEYRCHGCGARVEMLVRSNPGNLSCPHCSTPLTDKLFSVPHISRGLASREPGRTCCGQEERCDAPPCSTGGTCRHET